ncbi:MAG: TonB-dependent receptor [Bacteroidales bacterium]
MKKQVLFGLVLLAIAMQASAQFVLSGSVSDTENAPLTGASIYIPGLNRGTIAAANGSFTITDLQRGSYEVKISFVGFETFEKNIRINSDTDIGTIMLEQQSFSGEEVTISALRAGEKTPMAFTNMDRDQIAEKNFGQDIPYIVGMTPSVITSSDAGHGIGYTSMRIRGTDANRINVTINGVPLNDAETHSVFWVDLPDLATSTEQIQIQRGVGTSSNGAAAFGATVNMQTKLLEKEPYARYDLTAGSFNTIKNSLSAGTGLIKDRFAVDIRLSDLHSDGYIDRSWTDLQSYYLSAGWYTEKSSLKLITFGGFEELYQSWGGIPSSMLATDRTYNEMGSYTDTAGQTAYYGNQIDHYDQIHYQLHYSRELSKRLYLNGALHYTKGSGYYEQYKESEDYSDYNMDYPVIGSDTAFSTDLIRRKWLDNDFYGAIASLNYETDRGRVIAGGGWNRYIGLHFGRVIWAEHFGNNNKGHQWYHGTGDKSDWNLYGKYYYDISDRLTAFLDLQLRGIDYMLEGTDDNKRDVTQDHNFLFFNPKAGVSYLPTDGQRAFVSWSRASREPNRNNFTDAPAGRPPVPETLNDYEAGYSVRGDTYRAGITLYLMDYRDQLVLTGEINETGYPVMTNVEKSYRAGVELEAGVNVYNKVLWSGNLTLSRNRISDFVNYTDNWDYWSDPENEAYQVEEYIGNSTLAYSPSVIAASKFEYLLPANVSFSVMSKYVSRQYIDNTSNREYSIDPYFINDLKLSYLFVPDWGGQIGVSILVPNVLDVKYETNAWLYRYYSGGEEQFMDGYYPQAGRHIMVALNIGF